MEGTVLADAFETGDIVFRKEGQKLWRMFEDEHGLYLENVKTQETSAIGLEDDLTTLSEMFKDQNQTLQEQNQHLLTLQQEIQSLRDEIQTFSP